MGILLLALALASQSTGTVVTVTIDVTITERNGRPATGLAAGDFQVELEGQSRRILSMTYLPSGPPMVGAIGPVFDSVTDVAPVYRLVVEPPDGASAGREVSVAVRVNRQGAKVQAPQRAATALLSGRPARTADPAGVSASPADRLRTAMATGRAERGLPIAIGRVVRRATDPAQVSLDVEIEIGGSPKPPLTTLFGLVDAQGTLKTTSRSIEAAADGTYRVDFSLALEPGPYKLRFAAVDAAGTIGAAESTVDAKLTPMGPLLASHLLRWVPGRRLLILDQIPAGVPGIGATLELYAAAGALPPADLVVKIALIGADGATLIERLVTPESRDGALVSEAEFPLERVPAGTYSLRATVMSGSAELGNVSVALIKR